MVKNQKLLEVVHLSSLVTAELEISTSQKLAENPTPKKNNLIKT